MTEPLLPQILRVFKHLGSDVIPMLRAELDHHESGSFSPGFSKESICNSPADQYPIASPGGDDDTSMTSACSPGLSHSVALSSLLQISDPLPANSSCSIQPISMLHYEPSTMYTGSTKSLNSPDPNPGPSEGFPCSTSSHSETPEIRVQVHFRFR